MALEDPSQLALLKRVGKVARGVRHHTPGKMNQLEQRYALHLEGCKACKEIYWYAFEAIKLRLADNTYFTADFIVMRADGVLEIREVKPRAGQSMKYWCEEDAKIKVKLVAELFPFVVKIVWPSSTTGGWESEEF